MVRPVVVSADREVRVHRVPVPVPAPGEALVRMVAAGICGSDIHAPARPASLHSVAILAGPCRVLGVVVRAADGAPAHPLGSA